jgi:putative transposase
MTPAEAYASKTSENSERLHPLELRELSMPSFERTATRGWIDLFRGQAYFSEQLMEVDGQRVLVAVAWNDSSQITVRRLDGRFVCIAHYNGNARDAFPQTLVEKKLTERVARQKKLKTSQIDDIERQLNPIRTIEQSPDLSQFVARPAVVQPEADATPVFLLPSEREAWLAQQAARRAVG